MSHPYPVYFDRRPLKTVFIVNPKDLDVAEFSRIFDYNFTHYNGRHNPIVFTDGRRFEEAAWEFLRDFDPDIISLHAEITDTLLKKIEEGLSPFSVETQPEKGPVWSQVEVPRILRPTKDLISRVSQYGAKPLFTFFDTQKLTPGALKNFIHFNFGTYDHWFTDQFSQDLDSVAVISIDKPEALNEALNSIGGIHNHHVFPLQLCAIPNYSREVDEYDESERFEVVVGDTAKDMAHYWNRSLSTRSWLRMQLSNMWLPTEVAEDDRLLEGLQQLFQQRASRTGNRNGGIQISFVSYSLKEERLRKIAERLSGKVWGGYKVTVFTAKQMFPVYGPNKDYFHLRGGMDLYQAYAEEENIVVDALQFPDGVQGADWMLDVYIQYRPELFQHTNVRHWWRLPNRNRLTTLFFDRRVARIQKNGIPSVLMGTKSTFNPDESNLMITIPSDDDVMRNLIFGQNITWYTSDARSKIIDRKTFLHSQHSDKGKYLHGTIGLFGGLGQAHLWLRDGYWVRMLQLLSSSAPTIIDTRKESVRNRLRKQLKLIPKDKAEREEEVEWLSDYILQQAREYGSFGKDVSLEAFVNEEVKTQEAERASQGNPKKISAEERREIQEDLVRDIHRLMNMGVILMGAKPHCPNCGYSNWFNVDEIRKKPECRGCGEQFNLPPEEKWFYRLNSLVQDGVARHGLLPVILTLGDLHFGARSSFIYSPSMDLFKRTKNKSYKHLGDLDILCICDGKFVMGEIKQSSSLFKKKDFDNIFSVAKQLRPDAVLFASLDGRKTPFIQKNIKELEGKLKPYGIVVTWYEVTSMDQIFAL